MFKTKKLEELAELGHDTAMDSNEERMGEPGRFPRWKSLTETYGKRQSGALMSTWRKVVRVVATKIFQDLYDDTSQGDSTYALVHRRLVVQAALNYNIVLKEKHHGKTD